MEISKTFTFEAAHRLPNVAPGHKCSKLHGHSFRVDICISGKIGLESGWVRDFAEIAQSFEPVHEQLDHSYLNEIKGLENPTSENIARWIWQRLSPSLPELCQVGVWETPNAGCLYRGED